MQMMQERGRWPIEVIRYGRESRVQLKYVEHEDYLNGLVRRIVLSNTKKLNRLGMLLNQVGICLKFCTYLYYDMEFQLQMRNSDCCHDNDWFQFKCNLSFVVINACADLSYLNAISFRMARISASNKFSFAVLQKNLV